MNSPDYIMGLEWTDENATNLGDGVYAQYDGYHIVLRTDREFGNQHIIGLEPEVMDKLKRFEVQIKEQFGQ